MTTNLVESEGMFSALLYSEGEGLSLLYMNQELPHLYLNQKRIHGLIDDLKVIQVICQSYEYFQSWD